MNDTKKKSTLYLILIAALVLCMIVLLIWHGGRQAPDPIPSVTPRPVPSASGGEKKRVIEIEKKITSEIIRENLQDVGVLTTEEYYFTEVVSYSSVKKLWKIELGITESSYLISYDGVVTAGIDFSAIDVQKDDEQKRILIVLPESKILSVDIDPESFQLYSEKEGLGNPVSVTDYNKSLVEMEQNARRKALERGILTRADENAQKLVGQFVDGLVDTAEYTVQFAKASS